MGKQPRPFAILQQRSYCKQQTPFSPLGHHCTRNSGAQYVDLFFYYADAPQFGKNDNTDGGVASGAVSPYCRFHL
jgi:hypothetical protein